MKKFLFLLLIFVSNLTFGQTNVDIWKKSKLSKIFTTRKFTFPKTFNSKSPTGKTITYEKLEHPFIKIETSSGKKWTKQPIIYKSTGDFGVINFDGKKWSGIYTEDGYNVSNLNQDKVVNVKMDSEKFSYGEGPDLLQTPSSHSPSIGKLVQNNPNFYNPYIRINKTCGVYVEVTNDLFRFWGSDTGRVSSYVVTILTNVIALYDREGINVRLNKIYIWDTPDPYGNPFDNSQYLDLFTSNINQNKPTMPEAHFKHLLHNKNLGGIAWINGSSDGYTTTASLDPYYTCAVTGIGSNNIVNSSITYSWPVMCFTHEMGHNLGSRHTHWCGWKNETGTSIGRIDSCYGGESTDGPANCLPNTSNIRKSNTRGSIMSYCHLNGQISFTTGFGRLPRYSIRSNLNDATEIPFNGGDAPAVFTDTATNRTPTSAILRGNVLSDGGYPVQDRGFVWSLLPNPTLDLTTKISVGSGLGTFQHQLVALTPNTTYYFRSYAKNVAGISYGNEVTFRTLSNSTPSLTTTAATTITNTTVISGGSYISVGNSSIIERGVVLSTTNSSPTVNDTKIVAATSFGNANFSFSLTGLSPNTTYFYRAFARNAVGTSYGNTLQFKTLSNNQVTFSIPALPGSYIGSTSLILAANTLSSGGGTITERGFFLSTSPNAELTGGAKRISTTALTSSNFVLTVSSLTPNTLYYFKGYAICNSVFNYSDEISVRTNRATLTLDSIIKIESTNATFKYTIGPGSALSTVTGILVSTNPTNLVRGTAQFFFQTPYFDLGQATVVGSGFTPNTTYYARAIIPTVSGDIVSNQLSFTTNTIQGSPVVTTSNITTRSRNSISIGGEVTSLGTSPVFARGICYSTAPNPTINNSVINSGSGLGTFSITMQNLVPNAIYYIRAFATNKSGTSYGSEISGITSGNLATLTTSPITDISLTTANGGGNVLTNGGLQVTSRGIVWSTNPNPTIDLISKTVDGSGLGSFSSALSGLTQNTTYYVRSYAINDNGVSYGNEISFKTSPTQSLPNVVTKIVTNILSNTAMSGGIVTSDGGYPVTEKGICWSTNRNPTINLLTKTINGNGLGNFDSEISGLTLGLTYYVRAYATNQLGTNYGIEYSFTTNDGKPTVTTSPIVGITSSSCITGGEVLSNGNQIVTQRGVCWSTTPNPTIDGSKTVNGTGIGKFSSDILGLAAGTLYYVRAYATNNLGTSYGSQVMFNTFSETSGTCQLSSLSAYKNGNEWSFKFDINRVCATYSVNLCRYNLTDPSVQPTSSSKPVVCGIRNDMTTYIPTNNDNSSGFVEKVMNPQPTSAIKSGFGGYWYSIDVKCTSNNCFGQNITKYYFFVPGIP